MPRTIFKKSIISAFGLFFLLSAGLLPSQAEARNASDKFNTSLNQTAINSGYRISGQSVDLVGQIGRLISLLLSVLGILFLLLFIYGGITWMASRGNEQDITKAKSIFKNALIGLAVVLGAYALTMGLTALWAYSDRAQTTINGIEEQDL